MRSQPLFLFCSLYLVMCFIYVAAFNIIFSFFQYNYHVCWCGLYYFELDLGGAPIF